MTAYIIPPETTSRVCAPNTDILARNIVNNVLPRSPSGGTYDPRTATFPRFDDEQTFIVSIPGHEHRLLGNPTASKLGAWLVTVERLLAKQSHYAGWWRDGAAWVFDISIAVSGERDAVLATAASWGQEAIYHPASGRILSVPGHVECVA